MLNGDTPSDNISAVEVTHKQKEFFQISQNYLKKQISPHSLNNSQLTQELGVPLTDQEDQSSMLFLACDLQNDESDLEGSLSVQEYSALQKQNFASPLSEQLCKSETCLDDLEIILPKTQHTRRHTQPFVR